MLETRDIPAVPDAPTRPAARDPARGAPGADLATRWKARIARHLDNDEQRAMLYEAEREEP